MEEQQFHKNVLHAMNVSTQRLDHRNRISLNHYSKSSNGMYFSIKTHTSNDSNYKSHQLSFEFEEENLFGPGKRNSVKKTTQILKDENGNIIQKSFNTSSTKSDQSINNTKLP